MNCALFMNSPHLCNYFFLSMFLYQIGDWCFFEQIPQLIFLRCLTFTWKYSCHPAENLQSLCIECPFRPAMA